MVEPVRVLPQWAYSEVTGIDYLEAARPLAARAAFNPVTRYILDIVWQLFPGKSPKISGAAYSDSDSWRWSGMLATELMSTTS